MDSPDIATAALEPRREASDAYTDGTTKRTPRRAEGGQASPRSASGWVSQNRPFPVGITGRSCARRIRPTHLCQMHGKEEQPGSRRCRVPKTPSATEVRQLLGFARFRPAPKRAFLVGSGFIGYNTIQYGED